MEYQIRHDPSYALLDVELGSGEELYGESGAMVSQDDSIEHEVERATGCWGSVMRKIFGGESVYITRYQGPGSVQMAPTLSGDVRHDELSGDGMILQPGAFLASSPSVDVDPTFAGVKTWLGKEGAFLLKATGTGDLFFNAYGAVYEVEVDGCYRCDTGHMVAFEPSLDYMITTQGSLFSTFFSGEGLMFEFHGQGTLYMQTRHLGAFVEWLSPFLPS